VKKTPDEPVNF